eukprot:TRINITY_DN19748_c0_g1_i1.p1 TRINITY_DN19748_c0_g1~~TRINITY_DN19748_c0_g1_i1.p1  ORF type:complete len:1629 (-),score=429.64 TRINITY_DN19748_c0_g1_i1:239-5125(-)
MDGGGFWIKPSIEFETTLLNCTFEHNTAGSSGGAVYMQDRDTPTNKFVLFEHTIFTRNQAVQGGAMAAVGVEYRALLTSCTFSENTASTTSLSQSASGGALYTRTPTELFRCSFSGNKASSAFSSSGGAIFYTSVSSSSSLGLLSSSFDSNQAASGGAVVISASALPSKAANALVDSCSFHSNKAQDQLATNQDSFFGGGLLVASAADVLLRQVIFGGNNAQGAGAAYVTQSSSPRFLGCTFQGNWASGEGSGGGAMTLDESSSVTLTNASFSFNNASLGGAFSVSSQAQLNASGVSCHSNTASKAGGCMLIADSMAAVNFSSCSFTLNTALSNLGGGVLYSQDSSSPGFHRCAFGNNSAPQGDGGVFALRSPAAASFGECTFGHNSASRSGGVGMLFGAHISMRSSQFVWNQVHGSQLGGGALGFLQGATATVGNCSFSQHSSSKGGALYVSGSSPEFTESSFAHNSATQGAALFVQGSSSNPQLQHCHFSHNQATGLSASSQIAGGAVYLSAGAVGISACRFESNQASSGFSGQGGALWVGSRAKCVLSTSSFSLNHAAEGGAVHLASSSTGSSISGCNFTSNSASSLGGSVLLSAGSHCSVTSTAFTNSTAIAGGALFAAGAQTVLSATEFESCSATTLGGAVFVASGATSGFSAQRASFDSNQAATGGAVYWQQGQLPAGSIEARLHSCSFSANSASSYGVDMASDIARVVASNSTDIGFRGGSALSPGLGFMLHDYFSSIVNHTAGDAVQCTLTLPRGLQFQGGEMLAHSSSGSGHFLGTTVAGVIGQSYQVHVGCQVTRCSLGGANSSQASVGYTSTLTALPCKSGSIILGEAGQPVSCQECPATSYSLGSTSSECLACPEGATCPGGNVVTSNEGYWNGGSDLFDVYECPYGGRGCLGENKCAEGFEQGFRLCGKCSNSHTLVVDECMECSGAGLLVLLPAWGVLVGLVLLVLLLRHYTGSDGNEDDSSSDESTEEEIGLSEIVSASPAPSLSTRNPVFIDDAGNLSPVGITPMANPVYLDEEIMSPDSGYGVGSGSGLPDAMEEEEEEEEDIGNNIAQEGAGFFGGAMMEIQVDSLNSAEHLAIVGKIVIGYLQVITAVTFTMPAVPWPDEFVAAIVKPFSIFNLTISHLLPVGCVLTWNLFIEIRFAFFFPWVLCGFVAILDQVCARKIRRRRECVLSCMDVLDTPPSDLETDRLTPRRGSRVDRRPSMDKLIDDMPSVLGLDVCTEDHTHVTPESKQVEIQAIRTRSWRIVLMGLFILYPVLVTKMSAAYQCRKVDGEWYLESDVTLPCYDQAWVPYALMGAAGIILYAIGIPAGFFYMLYTNRDDLQSPDLVAKLGFLYAGYQSSFFLGELVEMTRKLLMTGLVMFIAPGSVMQIVVAAAFCAVFLLVQVLCNPYEEEAENKVNVWTLWATGLTVLFGMLVLVSEGDCLSTEDVDDVKLLARMILVVNLLAFVMIIWWTIFFIKSETEGHLGTIAAITITSNELKKEESVDEAPLPVLKSEDSPAQLAGPPSRRRSRDAPPSIDGALRAIFKRFDVHSSGQISGAEDVVGVCFCAVATLGWNVWPQAIEDKVEELRGQDRSMTYEELLRWFKAEIAPLDTSTPRLEAAPTQQEKFWI